MIREKECGGAEKRRRECRVRGSRVYEKMGRVEGEDWLELWREEVGERPHEATVGVGGLILRCALRQRELMCLISHRVICYWPTSHRRMAEIRLS